MRNLDEVIKSARERGKILNYFDTSVIDTQTLVKPNHPYENGIFITIQNHKCYSADIYLQLTDFYQSLCKSFLPRKMVIDAVDIVSGGLPTEERLLELCHRKIPILVCGIHPYDAYNKTTGRGSRSNNEYQHSHYYLYGIHHYLKIDKIDKWKDKTQRMLKRKFSKQPRYVKDNVVDIRGVGIGKYSYSDRITPRNLYGYLLTPYRDPLKECLINYISKHKSQYPTTIIYKGNPL